MFVLTLLQATIVFLLNATVTLTVLLTWTMELSSILIVCVAITLVGSLIVVCFLEMIILLCILVPLATGFLVMFLGFVILFEGLVNNAFKCFGTNPIIKNIFCIIIKLLAILRFRTMMNVFLDEHPLCQ